MRRYSDADIERARVLRKQEGYSFAHLQKLTGIPATTIRNWCAGDFLGTRWDILLKSNERKRQQIRKSEHSTVDLLTNIDKNTAKVFTALLYWCEGYKYPASNKMGFTNADPQLLKCFITLLRKSFDLDEAKFKVHLQIHDTHDFNKLKIFWSELLKIPPAQFMKPTVTKPKGGKHKKEYLGTCTVRYADFRIMLKLMGISEALINVIDQK